MTPDVPTNDVDGRDGGKRTSEPRRSGKTRAPTARLTQPLSSSGKHPLPSPWPQQTVSEPFAEAEDITSTPVITRAQWLPEPDYWLADHQRIPRPRTRPIARPRRFRRVSYARSALLAITILAGVVVVGYGMYTAGSISYQFFNAPTPVPTAHPATTTPTLPATPLETP